MEDENWYKKLGVTMTVEVGRGEKTISEILSWRKGTTVRLEDSIVNQLSIFVNGEQFGFGSILRKPDGQMDLLIDEKRIGVDLFNEENNDMR